MSFHSTSRLIATLLVAAIAVSGFSSGVQAQTAPRVTGTQGCVIKPGATTQQQVTDSQNDYYNTAIGCGAVAGGQLTTSGNFADVTSVNNAFTNIQNQINNLRNEVNEGADVSTDGSTIIGDGTAGNPIRLSPTITNRITAVETVNNTQNTRLTNIETVSNTQNTRLTNAENNISNLDGRVSHVEGMVADHSTKITDLQGRMSNAETVLVDHASRIGGLETTVASHGARLDSAESRLTSAETVLAGHTARLADHAVQLVDHSTRLGTVETKVASITTTVEQHSTWINNVNAGKGITNFRTNSTGPDAQATGNKTVAIGAGSVASHNNSVALGDGSATNRANSVSVGTVGGERQITNVAAGTENTDAANVAQLRALAAALGGGAAVGGSGGQTINGRAAAAGATDPGGVILPSYEVQGKEYRTVGGAIGALNDSTIKYDRNKDGSKSNSITLSGGDKRKPVQIRNVADGTADFDAVNVRQLREAAGGSRTYVDNRINIMQEYVDRRFSALSQEIVEVRKEARAAAAVGLATAALRYDPRPGKLSLAAGSGHWRGSSAMAMGIGFNSEDGVARYNLSASTADGEWGVSGGMSFTLN